MKFSRIPTRFIIGIVIAIFFAIALFFRAYFPYDKVFVSDWIKFTGVDAYYYMRVVDNLVNNFPHMSVFDPYLLYPGGQQIIYPNFFARLLAGIIWLVGLGSPTQQTIDVVGAYYPAVLGALTVIPVYFAGKELFNRWVGILAAGLIALLSGEFLGRSILGSTDHHVAEVLFSTVVMMFLIAAVKVARQREWSFGHIRHRDWKTSAKPIIYSLLAGIALGIYLLTWAGGLLFVFIIAIYIVIQSIIDQLRHKSTDYLCLTGLILFFIAGIFFLPTTPPLEQSLYPMSIIIAFLIPLVLGIVSHVMSSRQIRPAFYPLALVGLGLVGLGTLYLISPSLVTSVLERFTIFVPTGTQLTTLEMQPLLFPGGSFSWQVAWGNFTTSFVLSIIALAILTFYLFSRRSTAERNLLVVWSLVILIATIGQRRFAYYFAVNVALLTGYLSFVVCQLIRIGVDNLGGRKTPSFVRRLFEFADAKEVVAEAAVKPLPRTARKRDRRRETAQHGNGGLAEYPRAVTVILAVPLLFFLVYFPNFAPAKLTASQATFAPSDAWMNSLTWLGENTPEPFGNTDAYNKLEQDRKYRSYYWLRRNVPNPTGEPDYYDKLDKSYRYPESAYGVMAWWDYGYWITRIAHRIPNANPSQDPGAILNVASFFTSQNETTANAIASEVGTAYVITDYETATGKFWAVAQWAGKQQADFFDVYLVPQGNNFTQKIFFYPEYYRAFVTRLYNFDGKAVSANGTAVISYREVPDNSGQIFKVVTSEQQFESYEEAEAYRLSQNSTSYKLVGTSPLNSAVPLEALENYELIYGSDSSVGLPDGNSLPLIKIFRYTGPARESP